MWGSRKTSWDGLDNNNNKILRKERDLMVINSMNGDSNKLGLTHANVADI